jgi:hypothetical protein
VTKDLLIPFTTVFDVDQPIDIRLECTTLNSGACVRLDASNLAYSITGTFTTPDATNLQSRLLTIPALTLQVDEEYRFTVFSEYFGYSSSV